MRRVFQMVLRLLLGESGAWHIFVVHKSVFLSPTKYISSLLFRCRSLLEGLSMAATSSAEYSRDQCNSRLEILQLLQQEIAARALACDTQPMYGMKYSSETLPPSSILFPSSLMVDSTFRCYQIGLLHLVQCQASDPAHFYPLVTLQCLPSDAHSVARQEKPFNLQDTLQRFLGKAVENCGASILQLVPLQCLQWIQELEDHQEIQASWVHDMWFRWHSSFWSNVQQDASQEPLVTLETGVEISFDALHIWKATCGPGRMYQVYCKPCELGAGNSG